MRDAEGAIFGSAALENGAGRRGGRSLNLRLDVSRLSASPRSSAEWGVSYFDFPLRETDKNTEARQVAEIRGPFVLHLRLPRDASPAIANELRAAVWAMATFGGIGGRTRRGFGALQLTEGDFPKNMPSLDDSWIVQEGKGPPPGVPVLSSVHGARLESFSKPDVKNAWRWLDRKLKTFRQGSDTGRNPPGKDKRPGRSRWPEADLIRHDLKDRYQGARKHEERLIALDRAPRAVFGMPIIFHFKGEPIKDATLKPKGYDRLASPLILRPAIRRDSQEAWALVLLLGNRPRLDETLPVVMTQDGAEKPVTTHVSPGDLAPTRWPKSPLLDRDADPLLAFLEFCKDKGTK